MARVLTQYLEIFKPVDDEHESKLNYYFNFPVTDTPFLKGYTEDSLHAVFYLSKTIEHDELLGYSKEELIAKVRAILENLPDKPYVFVRHAVDTACDEALDLNKEGDLIKPMFRYSKDNTDA